MRTDALATSRSFLEAAGRPGVRDALRHFVRTPPEALVLLHGSLSLASGVVLRAEYMPQPTLLPSFAEDSDLLGEALSSVCLLDLEEVIRYCHWLFGLPFRGEFQFGVREDGRVLETFSASVCLRYPPNTLTWQPFSCAGTHESSWCDSRILGLVDDRWHLLVRTTFSRRITLGNLSTDGFCYPAFIKLRWKRSQPTGAKAYLIAGITNEKGKGHATVICHADTPIAGGQMPAPLSSTMIVPRSHAMG